MNLLMHAVPFILATVAMVVTVAFPTPQDLLLPEALTRHFVAFQTPDPSKEPIGPTAAELADGSPAEKHLDMLMTSGCIDKLQTEPAAQLDQCANLVAVVLGEVEREQPRAGPQAAETVLLVERLQLAAARVCQARWAAGNSLPLDPDDPVCRVSTSDLVRTD